MKPAGEPIFALLTDFGTEDGYVGAMKGRLLSMVPGARLVDISHEVPPFNTRAGAFCLANAASYFPAGTIFLVVVDPGVGSQRRGLVVRAGEWWFVGPDNGVFSLVWKDFPGQAFAILVDRLPWPVTPTFHGRDVFAPVAASLARSEAQAFLKPTDAPQSFWNDPERIDRTRWRLEVLHVDHFGNVIFNLHKQQWQAWGAPSRFSLKVGPHTIQGPVETFAQVPPGELLLNWDSSGYLQLACNQCPAAQKLHLNPGQRLMLTL